ncbi:hypothetical protein B484DRAFT_444074 [Ochromonadaceae sp. CCMP2298]|nr:hypothetical protein B484DRAFT_444074 [Ochromonadaceae sp. CCMP2298]
MGGRGGPWQLTAWDMPAPPQAGGGGGGGDGGSGGSGGSGESNIISGSNVLTDSGSSSSSSMSSSSSSGSSSSSSSISSSSIISNSPGNWEALPLRSEQLAVLSLALLLYLSIGAFDWWVLCELLARGVEGLLQKESWLPPSVVGITTHVGRELACCNWRLPSAVRAETRLFAETDKLQRHSVGQGPLLRPLRV